MESEFIVGIDLGTTNSALSYCAAADESGQIAVENIPQLANPNELANRTLLPSFLYVPGEVDFPAGSLGLPWDDAPKFVIGELARKRGAENPMRLVASAKSWLSHRAIDRTASILPWQSPEEVIKWREPERVRGDEAERVVDRGADVAVGGREQTRYADRTTQPVLGETCHHLQRIGTSHGSCPAKSRAPEVGMQEVDV